MAVCGIIVLPVHALDQSASVIDAAGTASSNTSFLATSAAGQGCPVGRNSAPGFQNHSGFLNTYLAHPGLDADGDGIVDENDLDDDNDGLEDGAELLGSSFSPVTSTDPFSSDGDGDGVSDGDEAAAGTNPGDADNLLMITRVTPSGSEDVVEWMSRDGRQYVVDFENTVYELADSTGMVEMVIATGGTGVWMQASTSVTNFSGGSNGFYRVRLAP